MPAVSTDAAPCYPSTMAHDVPSYIALVDDVAEECTLLGIGKRKPDVDRRRYPEDAEYEAHFARTRPEEFWVP